MDARRIDDICIALSHGLNRRSVLRMLFGLVAAIPVIRGSPAAAQSPPLTTCRPAEKALPDARPALQAPFRAVRNGGTAPCSLPVNPGATPRVTTPYGGYWTHEDAFFNEHFAVDFGTGGKSFPVLAAATGMLRRHDDDAGAGIYIRHNASWQTKYLHLHPDCGLIHHPDTKKPVTSRDPEFEVEVGTVIGWVLTPLDEGPHLHFALRGGSTDRFTSLASPDCCANANCNWSYPIPEIATELDVPALTTEACAKPATCLEIDDPSTRLNACCAVETVPGGMWSQAEIDGDTLTLAARAYPTDDGDPAIQRVEFTLWWPGAGPRNGPWEIGCTDYKADANGEYRCVLDLTTTGAPHGETTVSFDVYDVAGNHNLAPHGTKSIDWSDDGCGAGGRICNGDCVDTANSWDHCGRCNNRCGIFQICCNGVCGCDGTSIVPGWCWGADVICYPSSW